MTQVFKIKGDIKDLQTKLDAISSEYKKTYSDISRFQKKAAEETAKAASLQNKQASLKPNSNQYKALTQKIKAHKKLAESARLSASGLREHNKHLLAEKEILSLSISGKNKSLDLAKQELNINKKGIAQLKEKIAIQRQVSRARERALLVAKKQATQTRINNRLGLQEVVVTEKQSKAQRRLAVSTKTQSGAIKNLSNDIVRHIRRVESYLVSIYAIKTAYDITIGVGHEFNKLMENEIAGMKILVVQNLANVDAMDKRLSLQDKYNIAQREAIKMVDLARKINPETPYNLQDTIKTYKSIFPQLIKYKASLDDIAEVTKKMTILGKAMNLDTGQFIKTVDTAFTGTMKPSQMQIALNQIGVTNQLVKKWQKAGTLTENLLSRLDGVNAKMSGITDNLDTATSNFLTQWQELWGEIQKPLFNVIKKDINEFSSFIKDNHDEIVSWVKDVGNASKYVVKFGIAYTATSSLFKIGTTLLRTHTGATLAATVAGREFTAVNRTLAFSVQRVGTSMKAFARGNPILLAATVLMAGYEIVTSSTREAEEKLLDAVDKSRDGIKKLGIEQKRQAEEAIRLKLKELDIEKRNIEYRRLGRSGGGKVVKRDNLSVQQKIDLENNKTKTAELKAQLNVYKSVSTELTKALVAERDANALLNDKKSSYNELQDSIGRLNLQHGEVTDNQAEQLRIAYEETIEARNLVDVTTSHVSALERTADAAYKTGDGIAYSANEAGRMAINLQSAMTALGIAQRGMKVLSGEIAKEQASYLNHAEKVSSINSKINTLGATAQKPSEIKKVLTLSVALAQEELSWKKKLQGYNKEGIQTALESKIIEIETSALVKQKAGEKLVSQKTSLAIAKAELNAAKEKLSVGGRESDVRKAQLRVGKAELLLEKEKQGRRSGASARRIKKEYDRVSKAKLDSLNEELKQSVLIEKIKHGGKGSLPEIQVLKLKERYLKKELVERRKVLTEAGKLAKDEKTRALLNKEITAYLATQNKLLQNQAKQTEFSFGENLKDIFNVKSGSFFGDFIDEFGTSMQDSLKDIGLSVIDGMRNSKGINETLADMDLGVQVAESLQSSNNPTMKYIGYTLEAVGALLSNTLSQSEIDKATGRSDFSDESSKAIADAIASTDNPLLPYTKSMADNMREMNANFLTISKAIASTSGKYNLTGTGYNDKSSAGFLGFSSSNTTLLGSGLDLGNIDFSNLDNFNATGYTAELKKSSSFWGLVKNERVKETVTSLDKNLQSAFKNILDKGTENIIKNSELLGFDVEAQLKAYNVKLGKIDLKGLSQEEASQRINQAFSEVFSGAIGTLDVSSLVEKYQKDGEELAGTLGRIAIEFEGATDKFRLMYGNIALLNNQINTLDIVDNVGGLSNFNSLMNGFTQSFYSDVERYQMGMQSLTYSFQELGVALPTSVDGYRNQMEALANQNTPEASKYYAEMLKVSDQFFQLEEQEKSLMKVRIDANKEYADKVKAFWTGDSSPLSALGKVNYLQSAYDANPTSQSALDILQAKQRTAVYQEDYQQAGFDYLNRLSIDRDTARKTTDDLYAKMDELVIATNTKIDTDKEVVAKDSTKNEELMSLLGRVETLLKETKEETTRENRKPLNIGGTR